MLFNLIGKSEAAKDMKYLWGEISIYELTDSIFYQFFFLWQSSWAHQEVLIFEAFHSACVVVIALWKAAIAKHENLIGFCRRFGKRNRPKSTITNS